MSGFYTCREVQESFRQRRLGREGVAEAITVPKLPGLTLRSAAPEAHQNSRRSKRSRTLDRLRASPPAGSPPAPSKPEGSGALTASVNVFAGRQKVGAARVATVRRIARKGLGGCCRDSLGRAEIVGGQAPTY